MKYYLAKASILFEVPDVFPTFVLFLVVHVFTIKVNDI